MSKVNLIFRDKCALSIPFIAYLYVVHFWRKQRTWLTAQRPIEAVACPYCILERKTFQLNESQSLRAACRKTTIAPYHTRKESPSPGQECNTSARHECFSFPAPSEADNSVTSGKSWVSSLNYPNPLAFCLPGQNWLISRYLHLNAMTTKTRLRVLEAERRIYSLNERYLNWISKNLS